MEEEPASEGRSGATRCRWILLSAPPAGSPSCSEKEEELLEIWKLCKVRFLYRHQTTAGAKQESKVILAVGAERGRWKRGVRKRNGETGGRGRDNGKDFK